MIEWQNPLRIIVADDHALFRAGVISLISSHKNLQVVGEAENGLEAIRIAREILPDVILMDIDMPECSGLQATKVINQELPHIKIIILTISDHDNDLFEAIKAGATGYLLKDLHPKQFIEMLVGIRVGWPVPISGKLAARILMEFKQLGDHSAEPVALSVLTPEKAQSTPYPQETFTTPLSSREIEVLTLVEEGKTNKEIAALLCVTEDTVKIHVRNILVKLHLNNRVQAAVFSAKNRLAG